MPIEAMTRHAAEKVPNHPVAQRESTEKHIMYRQAAFLRVGKNTAYALLWKIRTVEARHDDFVDTEMKEDEL